MTVRELRMREAIEAEGDSRDGILSRTGVFKAAYSQAEQCTVHHSGAPLPKSNSQDPQTL
jgi:hypothetical protein